MDFPGPDIDQAGPQRVPSHTYYLIAELEGEGMGAETQIWLFWAEVEDWVWRDVSLIGFVLGALLSYVILID